MKPEIEKAVEVPVAFMRRYKIESHVCPACGQEFEGPRVRVYCSRDCYRKAAWERNGPKANERRRELRQK